MKKTPIFFSVAFSALLLAPLCRADEFTSRPALSNYTYAVDMGTLCGKGLVERRLVLNNPLTIFPKCDSQQHFLQTWKPITKGIIPSYVDLDAATGGVFDAWFSSHPLSNDFPKLAVTGLLIRCSLPVSYFDTSPPWRPWSDNSNGWPAARQLLTNLAATVKTSAAITNGILTFLNVSTNCSWSLVDGFYDCSFSCVTGDNGSGQSSGGFEEDIPPVEEGVDLNLCSLNPSPKTTNITTFGASVSRELTCSYLQNSYDSVSRSGIWSADPCGVCFYTDHGGSDSSSSESSFESSYQSWLGDAYAVCSTGLSAVVDFYEKNTSAGPFAQTDTWTYAVDDGVDTSCEGGDPHDPGSPSISFLSHNATSSVVIGLTTGIAVTNWTKTQTGSKALGATNVLFAVAYSIPALSEISSGGYSYSASGSKNCTAEQGVGEYRSAEIEQSETYSREVIRWNGYTPQTPRYLFRWNFNYN